MKAPFLAALLIGTSQLASAADTRAATLRVEKIFCSACAATVKKALNSVPGVAKVIVDVDKKEVLVHYDPAKASVADLQAATAKRGFPAVVRNAEP